ncbi:MAG TPA: hypothetical protein PL063_01200 [Candidatus Cloacimonadota bacterium]|nr:hypothetical protein [Candidatus Cloacimonadota bacterium]
MNRILLLVIILIAITSLSALRVSHDQLKISDNYDNQLFFNVNETQSDISQITLYYKSDLDRAYLKKDLLNESTLLTTFSFLIQFEIDEIKKKNGTFFEYYVVISNTAGEVISFPEINPEFNPYRSPIQKEQIKDAFILISPDDLSNLIEGQNIVISMFNIKDKLNAATINVNLNNKRLKTGYTIDDALLIIKVPKTSKDNKLSVSARLTDGQFVVSPTWDFQKKMHISNFSYYGNLTLLANNNSYMNMADSINYESNHEESAILQVTGKYKSIFIKNYLLISSLENSNNQKINKYYLGFISPRFDLHLGDYSPNYSEFTTYNKSVEGVSTALKFNNYKISVSAGRLDRKVEPKTIDDYYAYRSFNKEHLSAKMTYGNPNSSSFSLNFAKSKDNLSSLQKSAYEIEADSTTHYIIEAKDNLVVGADFELHLFSRRVNLFAEAAMSIYNSNINPGAMTQEELEDYLDETLPFDPEAVEPLIVVNKNMEPFKVGLNNSAIKAGINMNVFNNNLTVSFVQTGPSFYSLSSANIIQDKRIIRFIDNIVVSNQFFISGGAEVACDNTVDHKNKTLTTQSLFMNLNYSPAGLPFLSLNFINNSNKDDAFSDDPLKTDINNRYMQLTTGYSYSFLPFAYTTSSISYGIGFDEDKSRARAFDNDRNDIGFNNTFRFNNIPLVSKFGILISETKNRLDDNNQFKYNTAYFNNEYPLLDNKVIPFLNMKANLNSEDNISSQNIIVSTGAKYYPIKKTWLSADITYKTYTEENAQRDFNLLAGRLIISTSF